MTDRWTTSHAQTFIIHHSSFIIQCVLLKLLFGAVLPHRLCIQFTLYGEMNLMLSADCFVGVPPSRNDGSLDHLACTDIHHSSFNVFYLNCYLEPCYRIVIAYSSLFMVK